LIVPVDESTALSTKERVPPPMGWCPPWGTAVTGTLPSPRVRSEASCASGTANCTFTGVISLIVTSGMSFGFTMFP